MSTLHPISLAVEGTRIISLELALGTEAAPRVFVLRLSDGSRLSMRAVDGDPSTVAMEWIPATATRKPSPPEETIPFPPGHPYRTPGQCAHGVTFDESAAQDLDWSEVRRRWPRLDGECPLGCGYRGIAYASTAHYVCGDW